VRFRHALDFEFTAELAIFDLLDVSLCHAWVAGAFTRSLFSST
jgi:hypothetical protein